MKMEEIRKMKPGDMSKRMSELKLELSKEFGTVKMGRATKNPGRIGQIKKDIARMMTVRSELKLSKSKQGKKKNE